MRNMIIAHIFETTLRFEGEKKTGLGLRRRILQAFSALCCPPCAGFCNSNCWSNLINERVYRGVIN